MPFDRTEFEKEILQEIESEQEHRLCVNHLKPLGLYKLWRINELDKVPDVVEIEITTQGLRRKRFIYFRLLKFDLPDQSFWFFRYDRQVWRNRGRKATYALRQPRLRK